MLLKLFPSSNKTMKIKVSVYRYNSAYQSRPKYDSFTIPYHQGMTVLDAILFIYKHLDSTLAFRYECRQGICGTCGVMLNRKPVLSCSTQINPKIKKNIIEPLANFPVEKDLVVNLKPLLKKYLKIKPYIEKIKKKIITKDIANKSKPYRKCIECGCCIAGMEITKTSKGCLDPMSLVKIARYLTDPRDGLNRKPIAKELGVKYYSEEIGRRISKSCPRGIPIDEVIKLVK